MTVGIILFFKEQLALFIVIKKYMILYI